MTVTLTYVRGKRKFKKTDLKLANVDSNETLFMCCTASSATHHQRAHSSKPTPSCTKAPYAAFVKGNYKFYCS